MSSVPTCHQKYATGLGTEAPRPEVRRLLEHHDVADARRRYLDAVFYSVDGNFHSKQRAKPMDKNDVALTEGAAYFVDQADFERYRKKIGPEEQEVSEVTTAV